MMKTIMKTTTKIGNFTITKVEDNFYGSVLFTGSNDPDNGVKAHDIFNKANDEMYMKYVKDVMTTDEYLDMWDRVCDTELGKNETTIYDKKDNFVVCKIRHDDNMTFAEYFRKETNGE